MDAAQHLGVIHTAHTKRLGEEELDSPKLVLTEPKQVGLPSSYGS